MTRMPGLASLLLLAACAIPPPAAAPDPLAAPAVSEQGEITLADPAQAGVCVSQALPNSMVEMMQDGATVRPAAGAAAYALVLTRAEAGPDILAWRLLVAEAGSGTAATAERLRRALAGCLARLGRTTG